MNQDQEEAAREFLRASKWPKGLIDEYVKVCQCCN